jgi:hypothetical protein
MGGMRGAASLGDIRRRSGDAVSILVAVLPSLGARVAYPSRAASVWTGYNPKRRVVRGDFEG